jgi:hypothetical protein
MSKKAISTFEREMKKSAFKKAFGKSYAVKVPNKATLRAMKEVDKRKTHKAKNVNELFKDLD